MAKRKYDGVVECVRYKPGGDVDWVRAYERRGAIFSDHQIISRESLIQKIKSGKKFVTGRRVIGMASTFEIAGFVSVVSSGDKEILVTDNHPASQDFLEGVPVI